MRAIEDRGPPPACPAPYNLAGDVLAAGRATPGKIALARVGPAKAERWSYDRLIRSVEGLAGALATRGVPPGARVILRLGNDASFPVAFLATAAADLVPVVLSSALTAREVAAAIHETQPALLIADPDLPLPDALPDTIFADDLQDLMAHAPLSPIPGAPDRPGYIVFTSGTSGSPRAVVHAHRAVRARRMMWDGWYGLSASDRVLHAGAFNWTFTLGTGLLDPWAAGATALVLDRGVEPAQLPLLLRRHQATIFAAAPAIYRRLLDTASRFDLPDLRHGLAAGEKLSSGLRDRWMAATGRPVHEAFGMSECSTFISGAPGRPAPDGSLGYPQPGRRVAILGEDGAPVARGTSGTIAVDRHDPGLMLGYLGHRDETARRFTGGWFLTGDMGLMRTDGAIDYLGRADDMLNAGGVRVSPLEIEAELAAHPSITDCAVTEIEVKADTRVIAAFCISDTPLDEAALRTHMSERLASYKTPRIYRRVDTLPRNRNGKLKRRDLRDA